MNSMKQKMRNPTNKGGKINNPKRTIPKDQRNAPSMRSRATIKRLKMYKMKPLRNKKGHIIGGDLTSPFVDTPIVRVKPDRKWFGNTRIIGQKELDKFREEMGKKTNDPYTVILKRKHLPVGLLADHTKTSRANILQVESFGHVFGKKKQRKKPKLKSNNYSSLFERANKETDKYGEIAAKDEDRMDLDNDGFGKSTVYDRVFTKGQSDRIKGEVYKVIDSSDVLIQVLDARDPLGTRSYYIEKYLKTQCSHKHLIFVLNKVDLVPTWVTARWIKYLSQDYPTLAFHAHISKCFGKGSLIQLLRQFQQLHPERQKVSVGFFGYPNVGKSSVINALRQKVVCNVAPIAGETKVWQYITLTKNIYLVDCPGVVYPPPGETNANLILKGVVRIENVKDAEDYVEHLLKRIRPEYITKTYGVSHWTDYEDFLGKFAKRYGRLRKGGEPDFHNCATMIINDWQRGKLPWFVCPPFEDDLAKQEAEQKKKDEEKEQMKLDDEPDMDFEAVQLIKKIVTVHEFDEKDTSEAAFRGRVIKKVAGPSKEELAKIVVDNPLDLPDHDPLILAAKTRKWEEQRV